MLAPERGRHLLESMDDVVVGEMPDEVDGDMLGEVTVAPTEQHGSEQVGPTETVNGHRHIDMLQKSSKGW